MVGLCSFVPYTECQGLVCDSLCLKLNFNVDLCSCMTLSE